jgi:hypothetical protein
VHTVPEPSGLPESGFSRGRAGRRG